MPLAIVKSNHLKYAGISYFRGNAPSIGLGDYGEKKSPVLSQNHLAVQSSLPASRLDVSRSYTVELDFSRSRRADVELNLKVANAGVGAGVGGGFEGLKRAELKLLKLEVRLGDLKRAVNRSRDALEALRSYGKDARVVHQIFVVMAASEAEVVSGGGGLSLSQYGATLTAKAGGRRALTVRFEPGTTYAYLLSRPEWSAGKRRIVKFDPDQWGPS